MATVIALSVSGSSWGKKKSNRLSVSVVVVSNRLSVSVVVVITGVVLETRSLPCLFSGSSW